MANSPKGPEEAFSLSKRREPLQSMDILMWQEARAFFARLGIDLSVRTTRLLIEMDMKEVVRVVHEHQGSDHATP